nr:MAG TPA: hypothetical protein [Caudoviricetes sp.]
MYRVAIYTEYIGAQNNSVLQTARVQHVWSEKVHWKSFTEHKEDETI